MDLNNIEKLFIDERKLKTIAQYQDGALDERSFEIGWESAMKFAKEINDAFEICDHCHKLIMPTDDGEADYVIGFECILCKNCNKKLKEK